MIHLEVHDDFSQHVVVSGDEPFRVETDVSVNGALVLHVYRGSEPNVDDEPVGGYDGAQPHGNTSWTDASEVCS